MWVDADVTLAPDALARMAATLTRGHAALISGFPHQITVTLMEKLVVTLIQPVLLGYLPIIGMKLFRRPGFAAGCGQLMMARRDACEASGGHAAIRSSMHDGMTLPRSFRRAGFFTDIFDASDIASCRMYASAAEVWSGFMKNAHEGMSRPIALPIWTVLLLGGFVVPWLAALAAATGLVDSTDATTIRLIALSCVLALGASVANMIRFRQPLVAGLVRPVGVLIFLAIQWVALARRFAGRSSSWRGRSYPPRQLTDTMHQS